jgi:hypothetical protein
MTILDKDANGRVYLPEFRDFLTRMLQKAFERLDGDKSGSLSEKELRLVSQAFDRDHRDLMEAFGTRHKEISRSKFVDFIISYCMVGIRGGQVLRGLGQLILLGGPRATTQTTGAYAVDADGEWAGVRLSPLAQDTVFKLLKKSDASGEGRLGSVEVPCAFTPPVTPPPPA